MNRTGLVTFSGVVLALVTSACGSDTTGIDTSVGGAANGGMSYGGLPSGGIPGGGVTQTGSGGVAQMGSGGVAQMGSGGITTGSGGFVGGSGGSSTGGVSSGGASNDGGTAGTSGNGGAGGTATGGSGGTASGSGGAGGASTGGSGGAATGGAGGSGGAATGGAGGAGMGGSGGTATGGSGGASTGGSGGAATGGSGGAATGGSGGAATGGAGGGGNTSIDLTGTWISEIKTTGKLSAPLVGTSNANIDLVIRLSLTKAAGKLNGVFNICRLNAVTTPNANTLKVTFSPAVITTLTTTVSENDFAATVGGAVPVPNMEIFSGETAAGASVDADHDNHPGVTIPSVVGGIATINAYTGLDIKVALTSTLTDANTITGTTAFTTTGKVFGSDNVLLTSGDITVTPTSNAVPFTAKHLAGDVGCTDVLKNFP